MPASRMLTADEVSTSTLLLSTGKIPYTDLPGVHTPLGQSAAIEHAAPSLGPSTHSDEPSLPSVTRSRNATPSAPVTKMPFSSQPPDTSRLWNTRPSTPAA